MVEIKMDMKLFITWIYNQVQSGHDLKLILANYKKDKERIEYVLREK